MNPLTADPLPRLCADFRGVGGRLKSEPEDFEVEEIPAYVPSGSGEHLYLWVEKRDRDTPSVVRSLSRTLGIGEREIGYAGLKDKRAVTRQWFSVPAKQAASSLDAWSLEGVRILQALPHGNKLRTGHLRGNRFRLRVRDVETVDGLDGAISRLRRFGTPNYFGSQRFGFEGANAELGRKLLLGERLPVRPDRFQRRLYLSAFQSLLFNWALAARLQAETWVRALPGDVLRKHESGGTFVCEEPEREQPRVDAFELSPAGPLFGPKMVEAQGEVARFEDSLLARAEVTRETFLRGRDETEGGRRHYRVPLAELDWAPEGKDIVLSFVLPKGSYATVVLAELMGGDAPGTDGRLDELGTEGS